MARLRTRSFDSVLTDFEEEHEESESHVDEHVGSVHVEENMASESHRFLVCLPAGVKSGDSITVTAEGTNWPVIVPEGCIAGMEIEVCLAPTPGGNDHAKLDAFEVVCPVSCGPGDAVNIEAASGAQFQATVPQGCGPGSVFLVELPSAGARIESEDNTPSACSAATTATSPFSSFEIGVDVEVLRTNGSYTRGRIDGTDYASGTYTIRMDDGRLKYLVEQEDLRRYRIGAYRTGDVVSICWGSGRKQQGQRAEAVLCGYDDESETYTVALAGGQHVHFVTEDEMV